MRRRKFKNLPARGTVERETACAVQIWPPNFIVPLQIAQVQVSTELLEVSGMESKDSSPKTVTRDGPAFGLPKELACRRPPAAGPPAAIAATGSAIILIFFKLNAFTFPKERLK